jgi:hypothetical protein
MKALIVRMCLLVRPLMYLTSGYFPFNLVFLYVDVIFALFHDFKGSFYYAFTYTWLLLMASSHSSQISEMKVIPFIIHIISSFYPNATSSHSLRNAYEEVL